jgi:hypothetical protein
VDGTRLTFPTKEVCNRIKGQIGTDPVHFKTLAAVKQMLIDQHASDSDIVNFLETQFYSDTVGGCAAITRILLDVAKCQKIESPEDFDRPVGLLTWAYSFATRLEDCQIPLQVAIKYALALALLDRNNPEDDELAEGYFMQAKKLYVAAVSIQGFMRCLIDKTLPRYATQNADIEPVLELLLEHTNFQTQKQLEVLAIRLYRQSDKMGSALAIQCLHAAQTLLSRADLVATDNLEKVRGEISSRLGKLGGGPNVGLSES